MSWRDLGAPRFAVRESGDQLILAAEDAAGTAAAWAEGPAAGTTSDSFVLVRLANAHQLTTGRLYVVDPAANLVEAAPVRRLREISPGVELVVVTERALEVDVELALQECNGGHILAVPHLVTEEIPSIELVPGPGVQVGWRKSLGWGGAVRILGGKPGALRYRVTLIVERQDGVLRLFRTAHTPEVPPPARVPSLDITPIQGKCDREVTGQLTVHLPGGDRSHALLPAQRLETSISGANVEVQDGFVMVTGLGGSVDAEGRSVPKGETRGFRGRCKVRIFDVWVTIEVRSAVTADGGNILIDGESYRYPDTLVIDGQHIELRSTKHSCELWLGDRRLRLVGYDVPVFLIGHRLTGANRVPIQFAEHDLGYIYNTSVHTTRRGTITVDLNAGTVTFAIDEDVDVSD